MRGLSSICEIESACQSGPPHCPHEFPSHGRWQATDPASHADRQHGELAHRNGDERTTPTSSTGSAYTTATSLPADHDAPTGILKIPDRVKSGDLFITITIGDLRTTNFRVLYLTSRFIV